MRRNFQLVYYVAQKWVYYKDTGVSKNWNANKNNVIRCITPLPYLDTLSLIPLPLKPQFIHPKKISITRYKYNYGGEICF